MTDPLRSGKSIPREITRPVARRSIPLGDPLDRYPPRDVQFQYAHALLYRAGFVKRLEGSSQILSRGRWLRGGVRREFATFFLASEHLGGGFAKNLVVRILERGAANDGPVPNGSFTKEEVYVARHLGDRKLQRALMQFFKPENYYLVREALLQAGRADLIGGGCDRLIPAQPPREALVARRERRGQ